MEIVHRVVQRLIRPSKGQSNQPLGGNSDLLDRSTKHVEVEKGPGGWQVKETTEGNKPAPCIVFMDSLMGQIHDAAEVASKLRQVLIPNFRATLSIDA